MSTRSNRFSASFTPLRSPSLTMRNLRSAFASPTRSSRSTSTTSYSSTISTSPLTAPSQSRNHHSSYTRNSSPQSSRSAHSLAEILAIRRRPSNLEFEMQMEMAAFGDDKLDLLEPRPLDSACVGVVGIFEVLDGKC